ncbi:MAG: hypothetical protein HUU16_08740 [Candidatus Omnitrophica bacterium]|nr:hypothetical protein [Candidatus Omnitrophota bacterium]
MKRLLGLLFFPLLVGMPIAFAGPIEPEKAARYRDAVKSCLDKLLEFGTDRYGPVHTPMLMSILDIRTGESPKEPLVLDGLIRSEGRLHRRNPAGADLWDDQPLVRTLFAFSELTDNPRYAHAAEDYIRVYFERSIKDNGLLAWGTHIFYDAYEDRPGGDQDGKGPHEILVLCANWDRMWKVTPEGVRKEIEGIWEWHLVDRETGEHNRHDDKSRGCDFAFSGGSFLHAFAFLHSKTGDPRHLDWARKIADRHWNARNPTTNLAPDAPSTGDRYDAHHCFTTVTGPHVACLLKAYELSHEAHFKDIALAYIAAYERFGWDPEAGRHHAMLALDGTPIRDQEKGPGYDIWKPTGYVDIWRTVMFSYEFPVEAAQATMYAYQVTGDPTALVAARNWAAEIRKALPPGMGRRWRQETADALPSAEGAGGTYAENYGRSISFFLNLHQTTGNPEDLDTALQLADDAIEKLYENGWFKGHPAKPYYEATDGVAYLLYALLELAVHPARLPMNL